MEKKHVRFLWAGQTLANIGDILYLVALISILYNVSDSALFTSLVPLVFVFAQLISGVCAPLLFDRFSLPGLLVLSQSMKTILLISMAVLYGLWTTPSTVFLAFVFIFFIALSDGIATPTRNAILPRLVEKTLLLRVNSLFGTTDQVVQFLGWAFGGVSVALFGGTNVLWLTIGLYILATLILIPLQVEKSEPVPKASRFHSIKEGWLELWNNPTLKAITVLDILDGLAGGVWISAILLVYAKQVLHQGEEMWGFLNASYFVGMIVGGLLVYRLADCLKERIGLFIVCSIGISCFLTYLFGMTRYAWAAILLSVIFGPVHQVLIMGKQSLIQLNSPTVTLPKVLSARSTIEYVSFGLSVLAVSAITDHFGAEDAYRFAAALLALATICAIRSKRYLRYKELTQHENLL
ncbi:MFS transporter [Brevibacillus sp. SYSU BS000544]|uniref:MFS transporter n=1 Tax=Brevibacillus sp. SYSU BS000544 TaxID=3416443 RepID=UPI003CE45701